MQCVHIIYARGLVAVAFSGAHGGMKSGSCDSDPAPYERLDEIVVTSLWAPHDPYSISTAATTAAAASAAASPSLSSLPPHILNRLLSTTLRLRFIPLYCVLLCYYHAPRPARRFLVTAYFINWGLSGWMHLGINFVILVVLVVAKIPEMHGVRLFGVNAAPVQAHRE